MAATRDEQIANLMHDWLETECPGWSQPIPKGIAAGLVVIRRLEAQLGWLWAMGFDVRDHCSALANLRGSGVMNAADDAVARVRSTQRLWDLMGQKWGN